MNIGTNANPVLTNSGFIAAAGTAINVGYNSTPVIVDWNNDGKKDLVVGSQEEYIRLYLNTNTNAAPVFDTYSLLKSQGLTIDRFRASPEVVDLDKDGNKDLLVGDDQGVVYYYRNAGTDAIPSFEGARTLRAGNGVLRVNRGAHIDVTDWDEDGDPDVLVGDFDAFVHLFRNLSVTFVEMAGSQLPERLTLHPNYPNPFNASSIIPFTIPRDGYVRLTVYDTRGRFVSHLVDTYLEAGSHQATWDGKTSTGNALPSGIYIYKLRWTNIEETGKMILQK